MLSSKKTFGAHIELRHNQLRDLVCTADDIVFPESNELYKITSNGFKSRIALLPISPYCIQANPELVLCGGISVGNGAVVSAGKTVEASNVGRGLVNAVGFTDSSTGFACSNDNCVYFGDVSYGWRHTNKISTPRPLNAADCNQKNGMLALCGDRHGVQLFGGAASDWQPITQLQTSQIADVSTSVCFDQTGYLLSAAFQCGEAYIWDVRGGARPLATLKSVPHGRGVLRNPFRVVKFADSNQDYLFASEERGAVHVFDLRSMEQHVVLLDAELSVHTYDSVSSVPYTFPDTLGLATSSNSLVIATGDEIIQAKLEPRNRFPEMEWR